jgi:hypothetical protein
MVTGTPLICLKSWEEVAASIDSWLDGVLDAAPVRAGVTA